MRASINAKGRISRIYTDQSLSVGQATTLDPAAAKHLVKVLRHQTGDAVIVFNGDGQEYQGTLDLDSQPKTVRVLIERSEQPAVESSIDVHLIQAIGRGERMDWTIQKATELGVARITPLISERVAIKLDPEKAQNRTERWQSIAIHAAEQCGRIRIPIIDAPVTLRDWRPPPDRPCWCLDPLAETRLGECSAASAYALVVGPEGGFTEAEMTFLKNLGVTGIQLGPRVLRTETAGPAAIAAIHALWGDFK